MKTQIIIHLMPNEIDWFEWQSKQLKQCSHFLEDDDEIILDVTLNLNKVDWAQSKICKEFFVEKFKYIINTYFDWCTVESDINDDGSCMGCADKRRTSIQNANVDQFIYIDCDLVFPPTTLKLLLDSAKTINSEYYIVSPQIPKLWDESWYVLMNEKYYNFIWDNKTFIDPYTVCTTNYGDYSLVPISQFKLGGGWFNLISANLIQQIGVPESFGAYGPDDTFLMSGCDILKQYGFDVQQYVIKNLVVAENHKYRKTIYSEFLTNKSTSRESERTNSEQHYAQELQNLLNKIKQYAT